jgi:hypothetical protein
MSTQKALVNLGQSRAAPHAAVRRFRPYNQEPLPFDRRTMPPVSHCRRARGMSSTGAGIAFFCTGARDDPGSAHIEMLAALDGERLLIETRHGKEVAELSMACCTRRLRLPSKRAPSLAW